MFVIVLPMVRTPSYMDKTILEVALVTIGLGFILFRKRFARYHAAVQKESFNIRFSEKDIKTEERMGVVFGIILTAVGLLTLLDILNWSSQASATESRAQNILGGVTFVVIGTTQLIFRNKIQRLRVGDQRKVARIQVGKKDLDLTNVIIVAFSLALMLTGGWSLLKAL